MMRALTQIKDNREPRSMASSDQHVIEMQPQIVEAGVPVQQQAFDDNGELILFEGICWREGIKAFVHSYYRALGSACFCGLGLPCCIPLGNHYANKACDTWRLYLTDKSLCFSDRLMYGPECSNGTIGTVRIAITDIEAIQVQSRVVAVKAGCCNSCYGQQIAPPKTIEIEVTRGTPNSVKCCCWDLPTVLTVYYCDNADKFVEAVQKQMNTMVRD